MTKQYNIEVIYNKIFAEADKSNCKKQKVGAILVDSNYDILSKGHNHNKLGDCECVGDSTKTLSSTVHAERDAIRKAHGKDITDSCMFVTKLPCIDCAELLTALNISVVMIPLKKVQNET